MHCPPIDERGNRQFEELQHQAISAILERSTFEHYCFLTRLTETPGNPRPEELAFAVKGLLRCNFRQAPQGKEWRRLFGTTKRWWHDDNWKGLPLSWRSRVLFHTLPTTQQANEFISCCPLRLWGQEQPCPHMSILNSAQKDENPWVLLQVEDVKLDDDITFSAKLRKFLQSNNSIFKYHIDCQCPQPFQFPLNTQTSKHFSRAETIQITWQLEPAPLLHTGVSLDFAKAFFGQQREPHSRNLRLSQPQNPAQLTPALLVSSLKGVWRTAFAWLCEMLAQDQFLTSDYWPEKEWPADKACPVRTVFGGPLPQPSTATGQKTNQDQASSARGLVRFLASAGSYWPATARKDWTTDAAKFRFARKLLQDRQRDQALLRIETIKLDENSCVVTEIQPGPHATAALLALCLAADLISAGFFRVGRFTSRGFGIVRLIPVSVDTRTLIDMLEDRGTGSPGADSGFALLTQAFEIADPIGQLASWLQQFAAPSPGEAP